MSKPNPRSYSRLQDEKEVYMAIAACFGLIMFAVLMFLFICTISLEFPRFTVEYASVSLDVEDGADQIIADWNIGFSVENPSVIVNTMDYQHLNVSVKSLLGSSGVTLQGFRQHAGARTRTFDTVVRGPLPRFNTTHSFILTFDVDFDVSMRYLNWLYIGHQVRPCKATCALMKIELQPSQTYGVRLGMPVGCRINF